MGRLIDACLSSRQNGKDHIALLCEPATQLPDDMLLAIDEALGKFAGKDPVKAEPVKLRSFDSCTSAVAARMLGISSATAERF
jgi:hypothetical protein